MSRPIEYRAWDCNRERYLGRISRIEYDLAGQFYGVEGEDSATRSDVRLLYDSVILEQYTGLIDKNGEEIYDGDIVKFDCGDQTPAEVVYQDGSYFIKALDDGTLFYDPETNKPCPFGWFKTYGLEVIGNIHEDPELLGKEKMDRDYIREAIINKRKEEKMDKVWDTILGAILGVSIGFALAGIIASFAYRPTPMFIPRNTAHSIQIDVDKMYYTYIPALEEK